MESSLRECPGCGWLLEGTPGPTNGEPDPNWKSFSCPTCNENWLENVKYCKPETVTPEEL